MLNIQVVSDIHAEFWASKDKFGFIKPVAPILALLGDICCCATDDDFKTFCRFINEILPLYEKIIFIPGNHEYYFNPSKKSTSATSENTMEATNAKIKNYFKTLDPTKLFFLNNNTLKITSGKSSYIIIGSTLWSWIPEQYRDYIKKNMNDYSHIYTSGEKAVRLITPTDIATLHLKNYRYIKTHITRAKNAGHKVIVLTHHKPYISSTFKPESLDSAYESDLSSLMQPPVVFWGYGHTHVSDNSVQNKVWVYSNPKGYPGQKTKYSKNTLISIP